jgi:hypothetical protein
MGSKKQKSKSTFTPHKDIEKGALHALGMAREYADTPYKKYEGDRVAAMTGNEQQAYNLSNQYAGTLINQVPTEKFTDADMSAYMNPYIKNALDPAAREVALAGAKRRNEIASQAQSVGAFSGSRQILREREADKGTEQSLSDLYGRGYAEAFDRGAALWSADQDRALRAVGLKSDILDRDVARLLTTGQNARQIEQMQKDFDYAQFIEGRDWKGRNAAMLTDILRGLKGSYSETTTTKSKSSDPLGQILGAAATVAGAYFSGGGTLFAGIGAGATGKAAVDDTINLAASGALG